MLRTEQRRRARRAVVRTRILAAGTAVLLAVGVALGGAVTASANPNATLSTPVVSAGGVTTYDQNGLTCNSDLVGFTKPGALDGSNLNSDGTYTAAWGSISWDVSERTVTWTIVPGWDVDVCVKGGTFLSTIDTSASGTTSYTHTYAGLSHLGFRINAAQPTNDLDCVTATNYPGRALTNGDHINMDITQGGQSFQVNASVDIRQSQDPASESGLVLRVNAPGGPYTLPITTEQKNSGILSFSYATYLTDSFTVEWVQFNSTYFNQDRDEAEFLVCGDLPTDELVTPTARSVDLGCDTDGSYTLDRVEGIRWFIGDTEVQPGTYTVAEAGSVTVRAEAIAPDYGIEPGAQTEWTFTFTEPDDCVLPCLPASAVSYTYYNLSNDSEANPANSGLITVAARPGYSTELCNDFWVVAASWNYSSSTSIWPQTLRSTDPAGTHPQGYIGSVGTYFFHAPVACGQGDVYASFTGMPYVGPELFGPSNPFSETFLHNMGFTGPRPTYLNTAPGCNVVNPIAPTANPIVECGTVGSIDIDDVANPYIGYTVYRGAAQNGSVASLETVNLQDATEGVFTVVATPLNGYIFPNGTVRQWEFDLGEQYDCPVELEPVATKSTCLDGGSASYTLPAIAGVTWFVNDQERAAGTVPVLAAGEFDITFAIDADAEGGPFVLKPGAAESFSFTFTDDDICEPPTLPITNASIGFIAPTCDLGQQLDPTKFAVEDATLARYAPELSSLTGPTYSVVFVTIDEDARFFDSSTPVAGRTVSSNGTVLTFTGTLLGPDRSEECVTTIVLKDPVSYVDSCLLGASFTITRVEGIIYTVEINDDEPFVVVWNDGETTRTYDVDEGDTVSVMPSPASDRYTISPDPAPFERTFEVYDDDCLPTLPLTEGSAEFSPASCLDTTNRVTLESVVGVQWWINGEAVAAGTKAVEVGEVVVTATPLPGYGFPAEAQTLWEFTAVELDEECLPTLAITGATVALNGLGGLAVLLMIVGFGIVTARRQQA